MDFAHVSVLLRECIDWMVTDPDGIYVDCTLGGAGHSSEIVARLSGKGRLVGIDQDDDALAAAKERLKDAQCRVDIVRSNSFCYKSVSKCSYRSASLLAGAEEHFET